MPTLSKARAYPRGSKYPNMEVLFPKYYANNPFPLMMNSPKPLIETLVPMQYVSSLIWDVHCSGVAVLREVTNLFWYFVSYLGIGALNGSGPSSAQTTWTPKMLWFNCPLYQTKERERERDRETKTDMYVYVYVYIYIWRERESSIRNLK